MEYRNILVQVDSTTAGKARVAVAAGLATRFKSALTGVFLQSSRVPNYLVGDVMAVPPVDNLDRAIEERSKQMAAASGAARSTFDAAARDACLPFYWLDIDGDSEEELIGCARRHDLAILPSRIVSALGENSFSAAQVAMASGGPVLVTPQAGYPTSFGRRILVAWKDTREAARVIRDAWPFLKTAEEVCFLTVSGDAQAEADELLLRHLHRHDCKPARFIVDNDGETPPAEIIRRHVGMIGADLVVMGLYGHSRLREFVLGGVSRDLLAAMPMPLLVSH
jgi:nucleotide-binding universal stress UspA family protein